MLIIRIHGILEKKTPKKKKTQKKTPKKKFMVVANCINKKHPKKKQATTCFN